jgi:translation initiation factor IF-1
MPSPDAPEGTPLTVEARVLAVLPGALYRVELQTEARPQATVHAAGSSGLLRVLPGETVVVELSAYDATRGRIVSKYE